MTYQARVLAFYEHQHWFEITGIHRIAIENGERLAERKSGVMI